MQNDLDRRLASYRERPERERLRALLEGLQGRVFQVCAEVLRHRHDAEDAAQEAMLEICRGLERLRDDRRFAGWVYRIALNTALDGRRRRVARQKHEAVKAEQQPSSIVGDPDEPRQITALYRALEELDDDARELLGEHYFGRVSLASLAKVRGVSTNAIWKKVDQGRQTLRRKLEGAGFGAALVGRLDAIEVAAPPIDLVDDAFLATAEEAIRVGGAASASTFPFVKAIGVAGLVLGLTVLTLVWTRPWNSSDTSHATGGSGVANSAASAREENADVDRATSTPPARVPESPASSRNADSASATSVAILRGRVIDTAGRAVASVDVELNHGERGTDPTIVTADSSGAFEFSFSERTAVHSVVARPGPQTVEATRQLGRMLTPGIPEELVITVGSGGTIRGLVVDPDGRPVADATVDAFLGGALSDPERSPSRTVQADRQGTFELHSIGHKFTLVARAPGSGCRTRVSGRLDDGGTFEGARLVVEREQSVQGRVVTTEGEGVPGCRIEFSSSHFLSDEDVRGLDVYQDVPRSHVAITDEHGDFEVHGLVRHAYSVRLVRPDFDPVYRTIEVPTDDEVQIVLRRGNTIDVTVRDERGNPIVDAIVSCTRRRDAPATSDGTGRATLGGLPARGFATLIARHPDHAVTSRVINFEADHRVEFTLSRALRIVGVFVDEAGEPISHARVTIEGEAKVGTKYPLDLLRLAELHRTMTDRHGCFAFDELYAGLYRVTADTTVDGSPPQTVEVEAGVEDLRIEFDPRPANKAHFSARAVDARTGEPITTVAVTAIKKTGLRGGGSGSTETLDAPRGEFELVGLEPGFWQFQVNAEGYYPTWQRTAEYVAGEYQLTFELPPLVNAKLRILDERGQPLVGVRLHFATPEGFGVKPTPTPINVNGEVFTDEHGEADVEGLPARELRIKVRDGEKLFGELTLPAHEETTTVRILRIAP